LTGSIRILPVQAKETGFLGRLEKSFFNEIVIVELSLAAASLRKRVRKV
jgi:hypothetical protein